MKKKEGCGTKNVDALTGAGKSFVTSPIVGFPEE